MKLLVIFCFALFAIGTLQQVSLSIEGEPISTIAQKGFPEKTSWPELLCRKGQRARQVILSERPELSVFIIPEGTFVTLDYRTDRVRIFVNAKNRVSSVPTIG